MKQYDEYMYMSTVTEAVKDAAWDSAWAAYERCLDTAWETVTVEHEFFITTDGEALRIIDEKDETR